jgi:hypothetical protein
MNLARQEHLSRGLSFGRSGAYLREKYKTNKKVVALSAPGFAAGETGRPVEPVSYQVAQQIVWMIGWAYTDLGDEYYYWFPAEMVIDPFTGAVDYVPLA